MVASAPGIWWQCCYGFQESWRRWHIPCSCPTACIYLFYYFPLLKLIYLCFPSQLCQWLWPKLLCKLAKEFMDTWNAYKSHWDDTKPGPSGISHHEAYTLPHKWGGQQCLLEVDLDVVCEIKEFMSDGEDVFCFPLVTVEFEKQAEVVYQSLGV